MIDKDSGTEPETPVLKDANYEGETFEREAFIGVDASRAKLLECTLKSCTFSSVKVDDAVLQVHFVDSKIEGVNFFTAKHSLIELEFTNCVVRHASFASLKLKGLKFTKCELHGIDFADADLTKASFKESSFEDCVFKNTNLREADFRSARGYQIDPTLNRMSKAKFSTPEVLGLLASFGIEID